jgi:hypothetical protein
MQARQGAAISADPCNRIAPVGVDGPGKKIIRDENLSVEGLKTGDFSVDEALMFSESQRNQSSQEKS